MPRISFPDLNLPSSVLLPLYPAFMGRCAVSAMVRPAPLSLKASRVDHA
ncbi:MAG: hypothetical protein IAE63_09965 [Alphaproteobacteria bacterium]|nr:hypothetical protein [Alphaproteobacteria bacterium]